MKPLLLAADNFTAPTRTPWGGERIAQVIKRGLVAPGSIVGESWELSADGELPSRLDGQTRTLGDALRDAPSFLGAEETRGGTALLVKLLDAREPLSVQIHPHDYSPGLAEDESGKPESWYVEHAEPGAAIWLGLADHADRAAIERALEDGSDLSSLLLRVEVAPGDFFVVEAGTPHAIGGGVTLVEPQRVLPGRRGVTYRYWDWNRRYDAAGRLDPSGTPRALHAREALDVTDWARPRGDTFLRAVRHRAGLADVAAAPTLVPLAGDAGAPLESPWLSAWRLTGDGAIDLLPHDRLRSLTVLEGEVEVDGVTIGRGRTAALPASAVATRASGKRAHAILAAAR